MKIKLKRAKRLIEESKERTKAYHEAAEAIQQVTAVVNKVIPLVIPLHDLLAGLAQHEEGWELKERLSDLQDAFEVLGTDVTPSGLTTLCMLLAKTSMEVDLAQANDTDPPHAWDAWLALATLIAEVPPIKVKQNPLIQENRWR